MNPEESLTTAAAEWGDTEIRVIHEIEGAYFYEVVSHNRLPLEFKSERYAIAWMTPGGEWVAYDCADWVWTFQARGVIEGWPSLETRAVFRNLFDLIP